MNTRNWRIYRSIEHKRHKNSIHKYFNKYENVYDSEKKQVDVAVWKIRAYSRGPGPRHGLSEKVDPGPLGKPNPIPKFTTSFKNLYFTHSRVLISYMTILL